jgi:hypothetical protein
MSNGNRGGVSATGIAGLALLLAVIGFATYSYWVGHLSGYKEAETQHYQTEYAERTDERVSRCFNGADPPRECVEEAVRDNYEQQRAESDLNAQRNMADWAFWLLVVSSAGLGGTSIGTAFLAWQVMLTREAVEDTSQATRAMNRQNELAEAAQRPWLTVEVESIGPLWDFEDNWPEDGWNLDFEVSVRNVGNSLAVFTYIQVEMVHIRSLPVDLEDFKKKVRSSTYDTHIYTPNQITRHKTFGRIDRQGLTDDGQFPDQLPPIFLIGVVYQQPGSARKFATVREVWGDAKAMMRGTRIRSRRFPGTPTTHMD